MSKLQRRLIVLSVAVVLLLGPVVLMGNCSLPRWSMGFMPVTSCAVDLPLTRYLADSLYGIVSLSAFLLGVPILAYLAACLIGLLVLRRSLRRAATDVAPLPWKDWSVGARIGFVAPLSLAGLVLLGPLLTIVAGIAGRRAVNNAFAVQCRTAGEKFLAPPEEPVNGLYYEGYVDLPVYQVKGSQYQSRESDYGARLDDMLGSGWLQFTETPERDSRTGVASGRIIRRSVDLPFDGRPVEQVSSRYGVYAHSVIAASDAKGGVGGGTELEVRDLRSGRAIATLRYFARPGQSTFCGPVRDGRFAAGDFLVRALKLTRTLPQTPAADLKPVSAVTADQARQLQNGSDSFHATTLGQTRDSWILIDRTTIILRGEMRYATDAESLKNGVESPVLSARSSREYDCGKRQYRMQMHWNWSGRFFTGDVLRPLEPAVEWTSPTPGSVAALLVNAVCGAG